MAEFPDISDRPTHPYLQGNGPVALAHRGYCAIHPENSMPAFQAAVDMGYQYVETDVHATRDGVLVAFHDDRLDRLCDRGGLISEMAWQEVREARIDGREPIPLLVDLLGSFPDLKINIDPKSDAAVAPLIDVLKKSAALPRICVGSFSGKRLQRLRAALGAALCSSMGPMEVAGLRFASWHLPSGLWSGLVRGWAANCVQIPRRQFGIRLLDDAFLRAAQRRRLPVHVWTINNEAEMRELLNLGVDGIMSDEAELLRGVMLERGFW